jgi:hypothetical protein
MYGDAGADMSGKAIGGDDAFNGGGGVESDFLLFGDACELTRSCGPRRICQSPASRRAFLFGDF